MALALLALLAVPATVRAGDFETCDGYDAPSKKTDGMTRGTWLWGLATATVDLRPDRYMLGAIGVISCDAALADPVLVPAFVLRRANLLQAKGLHALAAGNHALALEALKQSDALGEADPYFQGSLLLGNRAIRAYVLDAMGQKEAATREIELIRRARPWSASIRRLVFDLRQRIDDAAAMASLRDDVPLAPEGAVSLYWDRFALGYYEEALDYVPAISFDLPKGRGGWVIEGEQQLRLETIEHRAELAGSWAFALAMTGKQQDVAGVLQRAEDDLAGVMAPLPPRADGRPPKQKDIAAWQQRQPYARRAQERLALWRSGIEFALESGSRDPMATMEAYERLPVGELPIYPGMLSRMKFVSLEDMDDRAKALKHFRDQVNEGRRKLLSFTPQDLGLLLPRHVTDKMMPVLKPAGDGYFLSDTGLSRAREGDSDIWTTRFVHKYAPIQLVEEMVMFGAATTALREGKDGLIVLSRRSAALTTHVTNTFYGVPTGTNSFASGYEAQLRVQLVDSARLPAPLQGMEWRVIKAQDVVDDLSKRYRASGGVTIAW